MQVYLKKAGQVKSEVLKIKAERTKEYIQFEFKSIHATAISVQNAETL